MFEDTHSILEKNYFYNKGVVPADPPSLVKDHTFTFFLDPSLSTTLSLPVLLYPGNTLFQYYIILLIYHSTTLSKYYHIPESLFFLAWWWPSDFSLAVGRQLGGSPALRFIWPELATNGYILYKNNIILSFAKSYYGLFKYNNIIFWPSLDPPPP